MVHLGRRRLKTVWYKIHCCVFVVIIVVGGGGGGIGDNGDYLELD